MPTLLMIQICFLSTIAVAVDHLHSPMMIITITITIINNNIIIIITITISISISMLIFEETQIPKELLEETHIKSRSLFLFFLFCKT